MGKKNVAEGQKTQVREMRHSANASDVAVQDNAPVDQDELRRSLEALALAKRGITSGAPTSVESAEGDDETTGLYEKLKAEDFWIEEEGQPLASSAREAYINAFISGEKSVDEMRAYLKQNKAKGFFALIDKMRGIHQGASGVHQELKIKKQKGLKKPRQKAPRAVALVKAPVEVLEAAPKIAGVEAEHVEPEPTGVVERRVSPEAKFLRSTVSLEEKMAELMGRVGSGSVAVSELEDQLHLLRTEVTDAFDEAESSTMGSTSSQLLEAKKKEIGRRLSAISQALKPRKLRIQRKAIAGAEVAPGESMDVAAAAEKARDEAETEKKILDYVQDLQNRAGMLIRHVENGDASFEELEKTFGLLRSEAAIAFDGIQESHTETEWAQVFKGKKRDFGLRLSEISRALQARAKDSLRETNAEPVISGEAPTGNVSVEDESQTADSVSNRAPSTPPGAPVRTRRPRVLSTESILAKALQANERLAPVPVMVEIEDDEEPAGVPSGMQRSQERMMPRRAAVPVEVEIEGEGLEKLQEARERMAPVEKLPPVPVTVEIEPGEDEERMAPISETGERLPRRRGSRALYFPPIGEFSPLEYKKSSSARTPQMDLLLDEAEIPGAEPVDQSFRAKAKRGWDYLKSFGKRAVDSEVFRTQVLGELSAAERGEEELKLAGKAAVGFAALTNVLMTLAAVKVVPDAMRAVTQAYYSAMEKAELERAILEASFARNTFDADQETAEEFRIKLKAKDDKVVERIYNLKKEKNVKDIEKRVVAALDVIDAYGRGELTAKEFEQEVARVADQAVRARITAGDVGKEGINTALSLIGLDFLRGPAYGAMSLVERGRKVLREKEQGTRSSELVKRFALSGFSETWGNLRGRPGETKTQRSLNVMKALGGGTQKGMFAVMTVAGLEELMPNISAEDLAAFRDKISEALDRYAGFATSYLDQVVDIDERAPVLESALPDQAPVELGDGEETLDIPENILELGAVQKYDGISRAMERIVRADLRAYGFTGDMGSVTAVDRFVERFTRDAANDAGVLHIWLKEEMAGKVSVVPVERDGAWYATFVDTKTHAVLTPEALAARGFTMPEPRR